jgi:hypothetical protein
MAHYRIYELDSADHILDGYSVVCRSDGAAVRKLGEAGEKYHVQVIAVRDCADRHGRRWDFGAVSWCRGSWRRSRRMLL